MKNSNTDDDIIQAFKAIANGQSIRKASLDYGIPRATLQDRINGHISHRNASEPQQKLARIQEEHLTKWVLLQESLGLSPTHTQIRDFAQRLPPLRGGDSTLGKRWMRNFLKINSILKTKKQFRIDSVCVNNATTDVIRPWFRKLDIPDIRVIKPSNRWNMDEASIMEEQGVNGLVVGSINRRFIQKKQSGSKAWTSFIERISATGQSLSPLVIFKGKSVQQQWFPTTLDTFKDWQFTATENGWTSDNTALEWLEKVFIPSTMPSRTSITYSGWS
ncbi:hypothetical protein OCU04_007423 [Sclerotinia nivalis]|uniref:HTH CENPB-type domain-containing protein n=1 Tax=Sclerotinia nivalis TaxID=352851 RepID=A0A9X0AIQ3_9HELO|nr:hypothetical protein OCU04_007423 [Sclerotinia nivalis]